MFSWHVFSTLFSSTPLVKLLLIILILLGFNVYVQAFSAPVVQASGQMFGQMLSPGMPQTLSRADSLKVVLRNAPDDTTRALSYINVARELWASNLAEARQYADSALALSKQIGFRRGISGALNTIGVVYYYQGWYDLALEYYLKSLAIRQEIGDKRDIANSINNIGLIHSIQRRDSLALDYLKQALQMYQELKTRNSIALAYNNIGTIYRRMKRYDSALAMHLCALDTLKHSKNRLGLALTHQQLGMTYVELRNYPEAEKYLTLSLHGYEAAQDRKGVTNSRWGLAHCLYSAGQYARALAFAESALREAQAIAMRLEQRDCYELLSKIRAAQGDYKSALEYFQKFELFKDSLLNEANAKKTAELTAQYDSEMKTKQIALLEREKEVSLLVRNGLFVGVVLIATLALSLYNRFRLKQQSEQRLQEQNLLIEAERQKADTLLSNTLPEAIVKRIKAGESTIADRYDDVTVMFADIVNFTSFSVEFAPEKVVELLDAIFSDFDAIVTKYGVEKIKTIGDSYMLVGGLPQSQTDHVERVAQVAIECMNALEHINAALGLSVQLRVGIHTGSVVAGVIGKKKFTYDLWGDTVNIASRMESQGEPGKIHVSEEVYRRLTAWQERLTDEDSTVRTDPKAANKQAANKQTVASNGYSAPNPTLYTAENSTESQPVLPERFIFEPRGSVFIKGKGDMRTYFLRADA
jgi:class 3 adenylate cyclase